ncbi:MucBP domain-containing protein [Lactococcus piscium]|uniref:Cell surface protein, DUF285-containing n=1 Tax=Pseudolactococcus piscium MKFS47 TaxID=297352 RepID=A0A0D6DV43_9LACT|nr:MucBP domain-containing protein [Lactococcus piscium]CEN27370.1 Cell surface protein, DUF285-containing [Lactococcus piscium MKFS47]
MRKKENRLLDFTPTRKIKGISGLILCGVLLTHTTATSATTLLETKAQLPDPKTTYQNLPETASLSTFDKLIKQNVSPQPSTEKKLDNPNTTSVDNLEKASVANPDLQKGVWGTCPVTLDEVGNLTVGAGELSRTFPFNNGDKSNITSITLTGPVVAPINSSGLLSFGNILFIKGMENLDTTQVTDMSQMFYGNGRMGSLDVSQLNTDKVTNMRAMFASSYNLSLFGLSQLNTANVTDMGAMFASCDAMTSLDLSNFDTSNVTNMQQMFSRSEGLEALDLSNFDTSKVTNMQYMFDNCKALETLDLSNFNTANVTDMQYMFAGSSKLTTLNLSNFDLTSINGDNAYGMFSKLTSLSKLTLGTKIRLKSYMSLPKSDNSLRWRDIGQGTEESPQGKNIWTATELLQNYDPEKHSGTYILTDNPLEAKKLTINYVDEAGNPLLVSRMQEGFVGDLVNISVYRVEIEGYRIKEIIGNIVKLTDQEQTLTFVYSKNKATLTINYVDEAGNQILDPKTYEGLVGDRINLETYEVEIDGYSFKKTTNKITEFTDKKQAVTLIYSKNEVKAFLTINYVDEAGNQILDPKTYEGVVGEKVNLKTYEKKIDGYSFKKTSNKITEFTDKKQAVTLIYSKNEVKSFLTINYVDEAGKQILDPKVYEGVVGERINLETYTKIIAGYSFKKTTNKITEFTDKKQTLTLVYSKDKIKTIASLTVKYVDETGKQLLNFKTHNGFVGDLVDLSGYRETIDGYTFKRFDNEITELANTEQTVTLVYSKNEVKASLTINYVDEAGNQILDPKIYNGVVGEKVNLKTYEKKIDGYSFKKTTNAITELTDKNQTVTLIYSKNEVKATLTINYVDEAGNQILDPKIYNGVVGEKVNLKTYEKKIDGYSFKKTTNAITELTDKKQTVTLVYSKNEVKASLTINYVDEAGNQILDPKIYNGVVGEKVNLKTYEKKIDGYSFKGFENKITELTDAKQTITLIYTVAMSDAPSDDNSDKTQNKLPKGANRLLLKVNTHIF